MHQLQVALDQHDVVKDSLALLLGAAQRADKVSNELDDDDD